MLYTNHKHTLYRLKHEVQSTMSHYYAVENVYFTKTFIGV